MFDLGWQEFILIAIVAIIVVSPKDLPQAIRAVTQFARQLRGLSREFRSGVSELVREVELDDLRRQVNKAGGVDELNDLTSGVDPTGSLTEDFDPRQFARELKRRVHPESSSTGDGAKPEAPQGQVGSAGVQTSGRADRREAAAGGIGPAPVPLNPVPPDPVPLEKRTSG